MNFSLGKPLPAPQTQGRPPSTPRPPGAIDMSLGPARKGAANVTPFADIDSKDGGPDWRNALSQWVSQHAYYPEQARRDGEEGDVKVRVVAQPNGRVTTVELIRKSGSMWLDLALLALFRDARIPPTGGSEAIEFNFTMHYILRRVP
jgi:periplasmic protein TonB